MKTVRVIMIIIVFILVAASSGETAAGPAISTRGYSVFDETIVDMTWPQVEIVAGRHSRIGRWYERKERFSL